MKKDSFFKLVLKKLFLGGGDAYLVNPDGSLKDAEQNNESQAILSPGKMAFKLFIRNKLAMLGLVIFTIIALAVIIGPFYFPFDKNFSDSSMNKVAPGTKLLSVPADLASDVKQISVGPNYAIGINNDDKFYIWGNDLKKLNIPEYVNDSYAQVSAGESHILALKQDGTVVAWGDSNFNLTNVPQEFAKPNDKAKKIFTSNQMNAVIDNEGKITIFGNENLMKINLRLFKESGKKADYIAFNSVMGMILTEDGYVYSTNNSRSAAMSTGAIPEEIQGHVKHVAISEKAAFFVTDDNKVVSIGDNMYDIRELPEEVQGHVVDVRAGKDFAVFLLDDNTVVTTGANYYNQQEHPTAANFKQIFAGYSSAFALSEDSKVSGWGLKGFLMGTDTFGRDVFARLLYGGRMSLSVGAIAVIISAIIGIVIGGISGYFGGVVDMLLMRLAEVFGSIPFLPIAMIISAVIGNKVSELGRIIMIMVILGVLSWPGMARLIRGQVLAIREAEFVTAAKALGVKEATVISRHVIPNVMTVILVSLTLQFATSILTESSLSFLGFGVIEPNPTWGNMLNSARNSEIIQNNWWLWVFPSVILALSTISINLMGDGLREVLDPRVQKR